MNFRKGFSKHASIIMTSDNMIQKYELVIKELKGQIISIEGHKEQIKTAFDEAKTEFNKEISAFITGLQDYRKSLEVKMEYEIKQKKV